MKPPRSLLVAAVLAAGAARAQEVTLPLERYEELRARARPSSPTLTPPPALFALEAANVEIVVGRGSARVRRLPRSRCRSR